ncbi:hypothetical protein F5879DRAFT_924995 [Lentinula edodes]|nr:hypothetical protein F5879DRAFT_924995 [Lentinula edodes]
MDPNNIDENKARVLVQDIAEQRILTKYAPLHLATITESNAWQQGRIYPMYLGVPANLCLIHNAPNGIEEVVMAVQGILVGKDLPPVRNVKKAKPTFLKQSVEICGFGSALFEEAVLTIEDINGVLARQVAENTLDGVTIVGSYGAWNTLNMGNRYFTAKNAAQGEARIAFDSGVDDGGQLEAIGGETHLHLEENQVRYYERKVITGETVYEKTTPIIFKKGDVVEVKLSLMLVKIVSKGEERYRTVAILRSLTLLDGTLSEELRRAGQQRRIKGSNVTPGLKRRVDYEEEMEGSKRMAIE